MSVNISSKPNVFLFGLLAGGTVGAIVALITTPKISRKLRVDINQKSGEYLDEKKIEAGERLNELSSAKNFS